MGNAQQHNDTRAEKTTETHRRLFWPAAPPARRREHGRCARGLRPAGRRRSLTTTVSHPRLQPNLGSMRCGYGGTRQPLNSVTRSRNPQGPTHRAAARPSALQPTGGSLNTTAIFDESIGSRCRQNHVGESPGITVTLTGRCASAHLSFLEVVISSNVLPFGNHTLPARSAAADLYIIPLPPRHRAESARWRDCKEIL